MIFVDYLGPAERLEAVQSAVAESVAAAFDCPPSQVVVRRLVAEGGTDDVELWIELSSDEQLYRVGQRLAESVSTRLREGGIQEHVWVMYRIVPLSHAFLNGAPRGRGRPSFE